MSLSFFVFCVLFGFLIFLMRFGEVCFFSVVSLYSLFVVVVVVLFVCFKFLPPKCSYIDYPATILSDEGTIIVLQSKFCYFFNISDCYLEWKQIRLLWIAFYKRNGDGKSICHIARLPKDLIRYTIKFIGTIKMDDNNRQHCIKLGE